MCNGLGVKRIILQQLNIIVLLSVVAVGLFNLDGFRLILKIRIIKLFILLIDGLGRLFSSFSDKGLSDLAFALTLPIPVEVAPSDR